MKMHLSRLEQSNGHTVADCNDKTKSIAHGKENSDYGKLFVCSWDSKKFSNMKETAILQHLL
jgi:hypothetical protein